MANPNGRKGTQWESDNRAFLKRWWPQIDRKTKTGAKDEGDLTHPDGWAIECKNVSPISLPRFLREAETEAENKGVRLFVALVKNRRSKGESGKVEDGYAVTRTRVWAEVAHRLERAEEFTEYVTALTNRLNQDSEARRLTPQTFAVLIGEALHDYRDSLADVE